MNTTTQEISATVPHLTTALTGPLLQLEKHILQHQSLIEGWLRDQWLKTPPPINCSVDIRNAGFKLSAVDTNIFPAGFNNLNRAFLPLAIQAMQTIIGLQHMRCKKVLIVPESHTRNPFYFQNLATLQEIITKAGYEVRFGSLIENLDAAQTISLDDGHQLHLEPLKRVGRRLMVDNFDPCLILLNNDLSSGVPEIFLDIEQKISPPPTMGWAHRSKTQHFNYLQAICDELGQLIGLDPWLINPYSSYCADVNFLKRQGEECLISHTESLFTAIRRKYTEYNINQTPFVVIKADAGTYGMGVMMVQSADELRHLNRKQRTNMAVSKGSRPITKVLLQEGVHSFETWGPEQAVAEPVVYMLGQHVIGGFYRVHKERGPNENLNSPGSHFEPLAFAKPCNNPDIANCNNEVVNRFYTYGVIGRLAALAAAREQAGAEVVIPAKAGIQG